MMFEISLLHYLLLASGIFILGALGLIFKPKSVPNIFISAQLMIVAICITFIAFSFFNKSLDGQAFTFYILIITAVSAVIGLALVIAAFRKKSLRIFEDQNLIND